MIDVKNILSIAKNNLNSWRSFFPKSEYIDTVVFKIFESSYAMDSIWRDQLEISFMQYHNSKIEMIDAFVEIEKRYSEALVQFANLYRLIDRINQQPMIGEWDYSEYLELIDKAKAGCNKSVDNIEFNYLFNLIQNKSIIMWAAFGRIGLSRVDAISRTIGVDVLRPNPFIGIKPIDITRINLENQEELTYYNLLKMFRMLGNSIAILKYYTPMENLYQ